MALNGFLSAGCGVFHEHLEDADGVGLSLPDRNHLRGKIYLTQKFPSTIAYIHCLRLEVRNTYCRVAMMEQRSSAQGVRKGSQRREERRTGYP